MPKIEHRECSAGLTDAIACAEAPDILDVITARWALRILLVLVDRQMRFSDLLRALPGIHAKVLTLRLRELEAAMLVTRDYLPPPAASQVYELSPSAQELRPALAHLGRWTRGLVCPGTQRKPRGSGV